MDALWKNWTLPLGYGLCVWVFVRTALWFRDRTRAVLRRHRNVLSKRRGLRESLDFVAAAAANNSRTLRAWEGWRRFVVCRREAESSDCVSLYLAPEDGRSLPAFFPGQYVTLSLKVPGEPKPLVRCYSLSDSPHLGHYRCTVKDAGKASHFLCRDVAVGQTIDVKCPQGSFWLNPVGSRPAVLIGAGIGTTPLMSMLNTMLVGGSQRPVHVFLQFRSGLLHPFRAHWKAAAKQSHVRLTVAYSRATAADRLNDDYHVPGRLTWKTVQQHLVSNLSQPCADQPDRSRFQAIGEADYYLCGPSEFMVEMTAAIAAAGVPRDRIHSESFGPSSVRPKMAAARSTAVPLAAPTSVRLTRSGVTLNWTPEAGSLLDLMKAKGIAVDAGCRVGNCGTCMLAVQAGSVRYAHEPATPCPSGSCLPCVAEPNGAVELEA